MTKISGSIVLYNNDREELNTVIQCFLKSNNSGQLYLIDNSLDDSLKSIIMDPRVVYIKTATNIGFGAAHNIAFDRIINSESTYHVIINPDIIFEKKVLTNLSEYLEKDDKIGMIMPKIVYPNGSLQRLAKMIPSPWYYFVRRFILFSNLKNWLSRNIELHHYDYTYTIEAPFLSGCFLMFRNSVLQEIKGFDERIFLYFEDNDICRKILNKGYKTVLYPSESVIHNHTKKSFFSVRNLKIYFNSGIYYFNKWGWFFDKDRSRINQKVMDFIGSKK